MSKFVLASCAILLAAAMAAAQDPTVALTITDQTTTPFLHHTTVTVQWQLSGGQFDPVNDYITSWWEPFAATYVEYYNISANTGTQSFRLLNARHSYFFRYYRGDKLLATSSRVTPEGSYPMQILSIPDPQDEATIEIIWNTNRTTGTEVVYYGTDPSNLNMNATAFKNLTWTKQQLNDKVGLPPIATLTQPFPDLKSRDLRCHWGTCYNDYTACELFVDPGYFHYAKLPNLQSNVQYYYRVGESDGYMSEIKQFHSRIAPGPNTEIQVLYVADAGAGYTDGPFQGGAAHNAVPMPGAISEGARHVWDAIKRDPQHPQDQTSIMNGDISYARGWPWVWELFANETEDIFGPAPVMASFGNHEYDYAKNPFFMCQGPDSGGEAGIPTATRFDFKSEMEPWYHIRQGPIHFFALSSEHSVSYQSEWLRQELPKVDRSVTPWLIVFFHRPYHESNTWLNHELASLMEDGYSDLFSRYGVDMVLTGHSHYYERMCAINTGECANYDYRPDWHYYKHSQINVNSCTKEDRKPYNVSEKTCKLSCMYREDCTGCYTENGKCYIITCPQPFPLSYNESMNVWSLTRKQGRPPVYVVDGTAGGVHVPLTTPHSDLTKYKDFSKWGYSRIKANATSLRWEHWHIDGNLVDQVTLPNWNV